MDLQCYEARLQASIDKTNAATERMDDTLVPLLGSGSRFVEWDIEHALNIWANEGDAALRDRP